MIQHAVTLAELWTIPNILLLIYEVKCSINQSDCDMEGGFKLQSISIYQTIILQIFLFISA